MPGPYVGDTYCCARLRSSYPGHSTLVHWRESHSRNRNKAAPWGGGSNLVATHGHSKTPNRPVLRELLLGRRLPHTITAFFPLRGREFCFRHLDQGWRITENVENPLNSSAMWPIPCRLSTVYVAVFLVLPSLLYWIAARLQTNFYSLHFKTLRKTPSKFLNMLQSLILKLPVSSFRPFKVSAFYFYEKFIILIQF